MSHRLLPIARLTLGIAIAMSLGQITSLAQAQDVRLFRAGETVDPGDVARILDASDAASTSATGIKFRSLKLLDQPAAGAAAAPQHRAERADDMAPQTVAYATTSSQARPAAPAPAALALPVQFEFDSATILPSATRQLDALAEGIRMLAPTKSVRIEGHTDATGTPRYNEALSQRRAEAVKIYLVAAQHIDPGRLHAVGMGQAGLLAGLDAHAAENRRVQFRGE